MKIADKTPFRNEGGVIDIMGRAQGTLKYGLTWYARVQAQDVAIAVMDKVLGANYVLLRNVTLPDTDIDLPLVLIGPPGIYLINVTHERGVYRARDEEWGTISGERFVAAGINQLQRTVKLGRVLQIYLDRAGYKGSLIVEPILMASDPGMHIESVRPAARIVMSDALERFAISMNQAHAILDAGTIANLARIIVKGPQKKSEVPAKSATTATGAVPENGGVDTTDSLFSSTRQEADTLGFSFDDGASSAVQSQRPASRQNVSTTTFEQSEQNSAFTEDGSQNFESRNAGAASFEFSETPETDRPAARPGTEGRPRASAARKKGLFGMETWQLAVLGGILLFGVCGMLAIAVYIFSTL